MVMGDLPGAEGATIVDQGTYEELLGRGQDLSNILEEQTKPASSDTSEVRHSCRPARLSVSCHTPE